MKNCMYCGKPLQDSASWCPYCEKEQSESDVVKVPVRRRRVIWICILLLGAACAVSAFWFLHHRPKVYEGGAVISYTVDGTPCDVLLSFSEKQGAIGSPGEEFETKLPEGEGSALLSKLFVYSKEDSSVREKFLEQMDSCTVSAIPQSDAMSVTIAEPVRGSDRGSACALMSDVLYSSDTGTNRICWEVTMKNKDVIRLYQSVKCEVQQVIEYSYEDTPMDTVEEIEALIDRTMQEDPDAVLNLYLPPVVYDDPLTLDERTANLIGTMDDEGRMTTFTQTVRVETRQPQTAVFYGLAFEGEGGAGIISTEALNLRDCDFTGFDDGVRAEDGSWVSLEQCSFIKNRTGFLFDSYRSSATNLVYSDNLFQENETAVKLVNVPTTGTLQFISCRFEDNQTDLDDPKGYAQIQ